METFKRCEPVQGIKWPCAGVEISNATDSPTMRLQFSQVIDGGERDLLLRLRWGNVLAFASWDELANPCNNETVLDKLPKLGGDWANYTFPMLKSASPV